MDSEEPSMTEATEAVFEMTLLMKLQSAGKQWEDAPPEMIELHQLLTEGGFDAPWNPQKLGIHLLTPTQVRADMLKQVMTKLYPFDCFWNTDSLEETLHKVLLACQQLGIGCDRSLIWGQCSMDTSFQFWIKLLNILPTMDDSYRSEADYLSDAKTNVITALVSSRGTDWDKQIARNFDEALGRNKLSTFIGNFVQSTNAQGKTRFKSSLKTVPGSTNWRSNFQHVFDKNQSTDDRSAADYKKGPTPAPLPLTTTTLASKLRRESEDMIEALRNIENYYSNDCVLQIDTAFELGYKVCELSDEFEGYMVANNRGAFRDVDALANHTDKVVKAMAKITQAYQDFFLEFQKYFGSGRGDEAGANLPMFPFPQDLLDNKLIQII